MRFSVIFFFVWVNLYFPVLIPAIRSECVKMPCGQPLSSGVKIVSPKSLELYLGIISFSNFDIDSSIDVMSSSKLLWIVLEGEVLWLLLGLHCHFVLC